MAGCDGCEGPEDGEGAERGRKGDGKGVQGEKAKSEGGIFPNILLWDITFETTSMESLTWEAVMDEKNLSVAKGRKGRKGGSKEV